MRFDDYQAESAATDRIVDGPSGKIIPLLGLAGETGSLLGEFKKHLRDGEAHQLYRAKLIEELGDILWYLAAIGRREGIALSEIAQGNLNKTRSRWRADAPGPGLFDTALRNYDARFLPEERLPRVFEIVIKETTPDKKVTLYRDTKPIGNQITDNAYQDDGYRFHDVFHFSYAAVLGWSPVTRSLLKCKRKSREEIDEVEDGGRAIVIEEGIIALVFAYAVEHNFLEGVVNVDYEILRVISALTSKLEVADATMHDWERAILEGFRIWRSIRNSRGGTIRIDIDAGTIALV